MVRVQLVVIVILESSKISSSFSAQAGPFVCLFVFINNPTFRCAQYSTSSSAFLRDPLTYLALPVGAVCNHVTILGPTLDKRPKKLSSCVTHHATGEEENSKRGWKQSPSST